MDLGVSDRVKPLLEQVKAFIAENVAPIEQEFHDETSVGDRWSHTARQTEILESLKAKARDQGLWNF
ncbi:MAG: acyl-CoA dehydrogenase, partial [Pseudomonadales bacterium]